MARPRLGAKAALAAVALVLACASGLAHGFAVSPDMAILNKLTTQRTITTLTGELNPYGLALIPKNMGRLRAGNFLATQWNDAMNNPGQGKTILQVTPQGVATPFATIDVNNRMVKAKCGTNGVGLTMALAILKKGLVVVGSTPIGVGNTTAGPGCLLVLSAKGELLDAHAANELTTTPGVMTGGGPWGMAAQESKDGKSVNLFVSYVLGTCPTCMNTLSGPDGGKVVRYQLTISDKGFSPKRFWGGAPEVIASGFPTQPGNIGGGAVGPAGLVLVKDKAHKDRLFIANNLNNSVGAVPFPGGCFTRPNAKPQCIDTTHAWSGTISGPTGLALSPYGTIVGANGLIGTLFEFAVGPNANLQLAEQLVDSTPPTAGAGTLFNVLFINNGKTLVFNDDGLNAFVTLTAQ